MKNIFKITILGLVSLLCACDNSVISSTLTSSSTVNSSTNTSSTSAIKQGIAAEDKVKPTTTQLEYTDHGNFSKPVFAEDKWYRNDLKDVPLPDPQVIEVDGRYYIYGTTDRTGARSFDCYETEDFNTFKLHADIYVPDTEWSMGILFAPEVYEIDGTFYMTYSDVNKSDRRYITIATSDSPTGPFTEFKGQDYFGNELDGKKEPLFKYNDRIGLSVLDQHIFIDDDGQMYMYYSIYDSGIMQYIVGVEMYDIVTPNWETYKILVRPGEMNDTTTSTNLLYWEAYQGFKVAEGPFMLKSPVNGKYYLTYSVNHYPDRYYTVCYAVSDNPLGSYTKPFERDGTWTNLLFGYAGGMNGTTVYDQWEGFMSGTAHHCFFKIGDQYMIGYHAHMDRKGNGRAFGMDYINFDELGVPYAIGPTYSIQPLPEAISGYKNIAYDANVFTENITHPERINDNYIVEHYHLPQEQDREVIINPGKSYIELVFDKEYYIGGISIYNSAYYDKALSQIEFINFFNGNAIIDAQFSVSYLNDVQEFIFPGSAFTFDFAEFKASRVVIGIDTGYEAQFNEIKVFGRSV